MADKPEIKVTRTYSLDPDVIALVTQRALQLTVEAQAQGRERVSDSRLVNDILTAAMNKNAKQLELPIIPSPFPQPKEEKRSATPESTVAV